MNLTDLGKEICWLISNLVANSKVDIHQAVVYNTMLFKRIYESMISNSHMLMKESMYIVANLLGLGSFEILDTIICKKTLLFLIFLYSQI
jgi:hypothetical protein